MQEMINKVFNEDCLETMKRMPDKSIDLVLTDPPYEIDTSGGGGKSCLTSIGKLTGDKIKKIDSGFDIKVHFREYQRILKKFNAFIFCSNAQISKIMSWGEEQGYYTTCLIWHKYNSTPFANGVWRQDIEFCIHIREKGAYFQGNAQEKQKVTRLPIQTNEYGHPTQKPLKLIEKYLKIGSDENHIIYDPFSGSGTTLEGCKVLNRKYIGSELDEDYYKIIQKRLSAVQGSLF